MIARHLRQHDLVAAREGLSGADLAQAFRHHLDGET